MNNRFSKALALAMFSLIARWEAAAQDADEAASSQPLQITITADPLRPGLLQYGTAASVVPREELQLKGKSTLGETLSGEPGVSSTSFGPGASRPVIRGNSGERIRVLQNGIGTLDISSISEDHAVTVDPFSAKQVEVLRGPETLLYGSSAIGGVVNISDASIPETAIGAPAAGDLNYQMGTGDNEISGGARLQGQLGSFNWTASGFSRDTDDIDIPGSAESSRLRAQEAAEGEDHEETPERGTLSNSATRTLGGTAGGSYVWEHGFFGAAIQTFRSKYGIPGHEHEEESEEAEHDSEEAHSAEGEEGGVAIDMEQIRVDVRGEVREVSSTIDRVRFSGGVSNYDHKELEGAEVGTTFENNAVESRVELVHREQAGFRGALGIQLQASEFDSVGKEAFVPKNNVTAPAVFLYEEYSLTDCLKLQTGGRIEYNKTDPDEFKSAEFLPFGVSAGAVYDITGSGEYISGLSTAYTQRAPSAAELYADGAHVARQIVEIGDAGLDEEASWGTDLTFKKNAGLVTGALNLFFQQYNNYINLDDTGEEEDGLPVFAYEDVRARFWGFELENTLHVHELMGIYQHEVDLEAQVDFVRAQNLSDDSDLPRVPPLRTQVRLRYKQGDEIDSYVEGVFVENQDQTADFELPTDSYQLLNAAVSYTLPVSGTARVSLFAQASNLTDEEARVHASFLKDIAPLMGRSFLFGLRGTF